MIYLRYAFLTIASLALSLLAMIIAPILPFFATVKDGPLLNNTSHGLGARLPSWLSWFMTPDNSLDGDGGWMTEHWMWRFNLPPKLCTYVGRVGWLWRNPAYSFGMKYIDGMAEPEVSGDPSIGDNDTAKEGHLLVKTQDVFQFVFVKRIGSTSKCLYVNLGWNIRALTNPCNRIHNYRATFVFSPRISGFYLK